jgi:uncharacterized protein YecE (DUF72 family)
MTIIVGTAGWSIPVKDQAAFPDEGTSLSRYAARFGGVEINSSFHRPHRRSTWERWAASVPTEFQFTVKLPKTITHQHKLIDCAALLEAHLTDADGLGPALAVHLVQLPPSLAFDAALAGPFFHRLSEASGAAIACEPRHASWFGEDVGAQLEEWRVARVAADPARVPEAALPGGWPGLAYYRLHGSPIMYRSSYDEQAIADYAKQLRGRRDAWCMFDNTASSAAIGNALDLAALLEA